MRMHIHYSRLVLLLVVLILTPLDAFPNQRNNDGGGVPPPPPAARQQPDERQERMMRKMGYEWDGQKWYRGDRDAYLKNRASVKSSNRFARFVESAVPGNNGYLIPANSPPALVAAQRLESVLQAARKDAMPYRSDSAKAFDRDIKNALQGPWAPPIFYVMQMAFLVSTTVLASNYIDWATEFQRASPQSIVVGLLAGVVAAEFRSRSRRFLPGVEEADGRIERLLADGAIGSIALPEANHIRYASNTWKMFGFCGETLASVNVSVVMNGLLQPTCLTLLNNILIWKLVSGLADMDIGQTIATIGAAGSILLVSLPPTIRAFNKVSGPADGINAECEAAAQAERGARAYYNMSPPKNADALEAADCLTALAKGWVDKFGIATGGAAYMLPLYTIFISSTYALSWQISGTLISPIIARAIAAADTYAVRTNVEANRANIPIPKKKETIQ